MTGMTTTATERDHARDVSMLIRDVPEPLRKAVARDALKHKVSFGNMVGRILGEAYGVETGEDARGISKEHIGGSNPDVSIRVPVELRTRIRVAAATIPHGTVRGVVIQALAEHYGKKAPAPTRRKSIT